MGSEESSEEEEKVINNEALSLKMTFNLTQESQVE